MKTKVFKGLYFDDAADDEVIKAIYIAQMNRDKVKIYWGDTETGIPWAEEHDTIGKIGKSTGTKPIALLVPANSYGGQYISGKNILAIVTYPDRKYTLYKHPSFRKPIVEIKENDDPATMITYPFITLYNGELHGRHQSKLSAQICAAKLR